MTKVNDHAYNIEKLLIDYKNKHNLSITEVRGIMFVITKELTQIIKK